MVQPLFAVNLQGLHDFHDGSRQRQRYTDLMGCFQNVGKIFNMELNAKARIEFSISFKLKLSGFDILCRQGAESFLKRWKMQPYKQFNKTVFLSDQSRLFAIEFPAFY